jgi:hypothetical protein
LGTINLSELLHISNCNQWILAHAPPPVKKLLCALN